MMPVNIPAAFLLLSCSLAAAQVRVWQGTLTLPTYEEGAPDPNPPFDQYANSRINYPYTLRDHLTDDRRIAVTPFGAEISPNRSLPSGIRIFSAVASVICIRGTGELCLPFDGHTMSSRS